MAYRGLKQNYMSWFATSHVSAKQINAFRHLLIMIKGSVDHQQSVSQAEEQIITFPSCKGFESFVAPENQWRRCTCTCGSANPQGVRDVYRRKNELLSRYRDRLTAGVGKKKKRRISEDMRFACN